jgi:hypothetical protein
MQLKSIMRAAAAAVLSFSLVACSNSHSEAINALYNTTDVSYVVFGSETGASVSVAIDKEYYVSDLSYKEFSEGDEVSTVQQYSPQKATTLKEALQEDEGIVESKMVQKAEFVDENGTIVMVVEIQEDTSYETYIDSGFVEIHSDSKHHAYTAGKSLVYQIDDNYGLHMSYSGEYNTSNADNALAIEEAMYGIITEVNE